MRLRALSLTVVFLLNLVQIAAAIPPSPELQTRLDNQDVQMPYYLEHQAELQARGLNEPNRIPYFDDFIARHRLDDVFKVLVILVDFSDNTSSANASYFDNLLFGNSQGTMPHYFNEVTYGNLTVATVNMPSAVGWRRAPQTYSYYVNGQNGTGAYPNNAQKLAEDAVALVNPNVDFSQYDNDNDGYVDALFIVHAGSGAEYTGSNNHIWSHAWAMHAPQSVDGVYAYRYTTEPEKWSTAGDMTVGVYVHEMGHMVFGLPDLYDTGNDSYGVGKWSLMAGGSWNGALGSSPAHPDAWCKIRMNVVTPTVVSGTSNAASIPASETSQTIYKLTSSSNSQQYVLVENRQQTGYDASLPGNGLLIYHVDDAQGTNANQWYPGHTSSGHYKVALEQADGLWQLEQETSQGNSGDPWPGSSNRRAYNSTSTPNSLDYNGLNQGISVTNISNSGATMTADLVGSAPASITLTSPNGGETWVEGSVATITWTSTGLNENVKIELNRSYPTGSWVTLVTSAPNTGTYDRSVPTGTTSSARLRISGVSHTSISDVSNANFTVNAGTITLTSPNGGETWVESTTDTIKWTSNGFGDNVKIELNRTYPTGSWVTLVSSAPNTGSYPRNVPTGATSTARIRISRVTRSDINDISDANFTISAGTITVTEPNGGETWIEGTTDTIKWTSSNYSGNVTIEINRSYPSGTWTALATNVPNNGVYPRNVPTGATSTARIRVKGASRTDIYDDSDANFTVSGGTITVTEPNGGETWIEGTTDTIKWTSSNYTGNVTIEINRSYPSGTWAALATNVPNNGVYPRNVPTGATSTARIRVKGAVRTDIYDDSNANFTVSGGTITVTSPNGGETWVEGTTDTIKWTSSNYTGNVTIEINRSYPSGTWAALATNVPNNGVYPRNVPTGASTTARIRVKGATRTDIYDISDAHFAVVQYSAPHNSGGIGVESVPAEFELFQNYPNPFNASTTIRFSIPEAAQVKLSIFNSTGEQVTTLTDSYLPAGVFEYHWTGQDIYGSSVASGVYFCRLLSNSQSDVKRIVYMK